MLKESEGFDKCSWIGGMSDLLHDHVVRVGEGNPNHNHAAAKPVLEVDALAAT